MPITLDFTGKLVLVTGGGRGIGFAISKALAEAGADVAISYTSKDATPVAKELSDKYGKKIRAFKCEVTKSSEVDALVEQVRNEYNREIDICVANAEDFQSIFAVNTFGAYYLSRALIRSWLGLPVSVNSASDPIDIASMRNVDLKKQILFVSSISALVAMSPQRQSAYNASKGAVTMLAKSLAGEWSHIGVAVNSVSPGYVSTDMIANPPDATASNWVKEWEKRTPVGRYVYVIFALRFATADEIGGFVATLLSDKMGGMGFMTGSDVVVDGGYTIF
ncbi:hypothetical protein D1P53_003207 [Cryptococcus gattii VGV]|nr:hypothetical protein D1P53_003207 [Cryptococcus gattii VGV]